MKNSLAESKPLDLQGNGDANLMAALDLSHITSNPGATPTASPVQAMKQALGRLLTRSLLLVQF
jgi:hypothetical protein